MYQYCRRSSFVLYFVLALCVSYSSAKGQSTEYGVFGKPKEISFHFTEGQITDWQNKKYADALYKKLYKLAVEDGILLVHYEEGDSDNDYTHRFGIEFTSTSQKMYFINGFKSITEIYKVYIGHPGRKQKSGVNEDIDVRLNPLKEGYDPEYDLSDEFPFLFEIDPPFRDLDVTVDSSLYDFIHNIFIDARTVKFYTDMAEGRDIYYRRCNETISSKDYMADVLAFILMDNYQLIDKQFFNALGKGLTSKQEGFHELGKLTAKIVMDYRFSTHNNYDRYVNAEDKKIKLLNSMYTHPIRDRIEMITHDRCPKGKLPYGDLPENN
ncbi:MAG: hypothetical protein KDD52_09060 [Bdellovibrionales bacterium]|nr:hypothetical protein [Bdellovibrionales bacterium]